MTRLNGTSSLLDLKAVRDVLGVSKSTLDRYVRRGQLRVVTRLERGHGKPSPMFDPRAVQAFAESRQQAMALGHSQPTE
jgi:hypothetical protein